ncbi:hypothetical protein ALPR1_14954 [Algoriphagus machipongonensis]|uniref:Uncharacterized protein n=1 Tax=Algoriphagus machipongonensis TaxID=388413 RepID=A3I0E2_9BACT|nr:hypothetical protein ALPR1_14954 [Algoriphagus machipongonensis]
MKTRSKKYKLKHDFPFIEICGICSFLILLGISIKSYFNDFEIDWLFIIVGISVGLIFFYWLTNSRNRTIIFENETIKIKPLLKFSAIVLKLNEIQGYRLKETYTRTGLDYNIQLITKENKNYEFIRDAYSNYHRLPAYLKNSGIKYLGTKEITWKYKYIYSRIGVYASIISVILFFLVQLMKILK